jgi:Putative prokaryotic signal transducing protein
MSAMIQLTVAGDVSEAEEIQAILSSAGIPSKLESAVEHHPREVENAPTKVLVPDAQLDDAKEAIEALTEPDELISDA